MRDTSWSHLWHNKQLELSFFQGFHAQHSYPRHSHDYYVIAVVDKGLQSFAFANRRYVTPVNGLILLNPGEMHTGEPVGEAGFGFSAFYPTATHLQAVLGELPGYSAVPSFSMPRADDLPMAQAVRSLHAALKNKANSLEVESKFLLTLVALLTRFSDQPSSTPKPGSEHLAVKRVRNYIKENYAEPISLDELAEYTHLSRYYLLNLFRNEVGMPPHTYLETVRVQQSRKLLLEGQPLAQVAQQVGFSSQSHFTSRFKHIMGATPGEYARQLKS